MVVILDCNKLWYIRQEGLTYNIIQIYQGNDRLIFIVDLMCIAYIIGKEGQPLPTHGPWRGYKYNHVPHGTTYYQLFRDEKWIGFFLKTKEECEALTNGEEILWTEETLKR